MKLTTNVFYDGNTSASGTHLGRNIDGLAPSKVNAWDFLEGSQVIRRNIENVGRVQSILEAKMYDLAEGISEESVKNGIKGATRKADLIKRLEAKGSSSEQFAEELAAKGRAIDHPQSVPNQNAFDNIDPNINSADVDAAFANRAAATAKQQKIVASELLGEARVDQVLQSKNCTRLDIPPDYNVAGKQGQFDRIYEGPDGKVYVVEAKGGGSTLGTRKIADGTIAQQGTRAYRDDIIANLRNKLGDGTPIMDKIDDALEDGLLDYLYVGQKTNDLSNFAVKIFQ